jgi:hypothetical protein
MTVWTISAQPGTRGLEIAAGLSARAGVPLFDQQTLEPIVHEFSPDLRELGDLNDVEGRFGGRLNALALAAAMTCGAPDAFREFELRQTTARGPGQSRQSARSDPLAATGCADDGGSDGADRGASGGDALSPPALRRRGDSTAGRGS